MKELSVLIVEDDPLIREVICETLYDACFKVMDADTPAHAHAVLDSAAAIDAALIDIDLGEQETGYDVARHARETRPGLMAVYTSGGVREDFERERAPGGLFLPEPYLPSQVRQLLRTTLQ